MAATETLLVVENETAIKALVQMALERHGYVVLTAESGSEDSSSPSDRASPRSSCLVTWTTHWAKTPLPRRFL